MKAVILLHLRAKINFYPQFPHLLSDLIEIQYKRPAKQQSCILVYFMKISERAVLFMKLHLGMYRETKGMEVINALVKCVYTKLLFYALIAFPPKVAAIKKDVNEK
jgi:hypothetical protein